MVHLVPNTLSKQCASGAVGHTHKSPAQNTVPGTYSRCSTLALNRQMGSQPLPTHAKQAGVHRKHPSSIPPHPTPHVTFVIIFKVISSASPSLFLTVLKMQASTRRARALEGCVINTNTPPPPPHPRPGRKGKANEGRDGDLPQGYRKPSPHYVPVPKDPLTFWDCKYPR